MITGLKTKRNKRKYQVVRSIWHANCSDISIVSGLTHEEASHIALGFNQVLQEVTTESNLPFAVFFVVQRMKKGNK